MTYNYKYSLGIYVNDWGFGTGTDSVSDTAGKVFENNQHATITL